MDFDVNGFSLSEDHLGEIADALIKIERKYRNLRHKSMRLIFQSSEDELRREDLQFLESAGELTREKILEKLEQFLGRMIASTSAGYWLLANIELNGDA
jgi:predicted HAD superfamily phosphohydrolase